MRPFPVIAGCLLVEAHSALRMKAGVRNSGLFLVWWAEQWVGWAGLPIIAKLVLFVAVSESPEPHVHGFGASG